MKSRFRRRRQRTAGRLHPGVIVAICLGAAVILTLVVGNLLKLWLDDETFLRLTSGMETEAETDAPTKQQMRNVNAYDFAFGDKTDVIAGRTAASVALNRADGLLSYRSDVGDYLGVSDEKGAELGEAMGDLTATVPYISGVFRSRAATHEVASVRSAATANEAALIKEFLGFGGDEVIVRDLPLSVEHIGRTVEYIKLLKSYLGETPVGVSVPLSVANSEYGWWIVSELLKVCDFCALDVSSEPLAPESTEGTAETEPDTAEPDTEGGSDAASRTARQLLADCGYFLQQYKMRLLLSPTQTDLVTLLETTWFPNYQLAAP